MEQTYLMQDKNGMLVRVPKSKLAAWSAQQSGEAKTPGVENSERLRQEIRQRLGVK